MRIFVTVSDQVWGGKHSYLFQVLAAWRDAGHEIIVCAEASGEFLARSQASSYTCVTVTNFVADSTATHEQLVHFLAQQTMDLLLSTGRRDSLLLYLATQEAQVTDLPRFILRSSAFPIEFDAVQEEVYATATEILLYTRRQIEQQFQTLIDKGRLQEKSFRIFPANIDTQIFQPRSPSASIREEFAIPPDVPVIGCVARLSWEKDHVTILHAFARLHQLYPDAILLLVGGGDEQAPLETLAINLGIHEAIRFTGDRQDVTSLLSVMTVKVLASICHETGAIALMESMAMSVPVISSNMGVMPEYIRPHETGWLFDAGDIDGLLGCMKAVLADPELTAQIAQRGRQEILTHYDKGIWMAAYCDFLESIDQQEP